MKLLNESTLILNKYFLAVQVCSARDAITALVSGKAEVVDQEYKRYKLKEWQQESSFIIGDKLRSILYPGVVHSPSTTLVVPQVIIASDCEYSSPAIKTVRYSRKNVYQRDRYTCQYCGEKMIKSELTLDHITPKSRGGTNSWNNVVASCRKCNSKKKDKLLSELGWELLSEPKQPKWRSHIGSPFSLQKKEYWNTFLK